MKTVLGWVLALALLGGGAVGTVFLYQKGRAERDQEAEREKPIEGHSRISRTPQGELALEFPPDDRSRLGLKTALLKGRTELPEVVAYGRVLSPVPLLSLEADLGAAQAALPTSKAEFERTRTLFQENANASRKAFEAAQSQYLIDENRVKSLRRQISAEWGEVITSVAPQEVDGAIEKLSKRELVLVRVNLLPGTLLAARPKSARLSVLGEEGQVYATSRIYDPPQADSKSQGRGFVLAVQAPGASLSPGAAVTAHLGIEGDAVSGFEIPSSALVRYAGKTWVYVQADDRHFVRREVTLDRPAPGGWFSATSLGDKVQILIEGPQMLLSEELKEQIHVEQ